MYIVVESMDHRDAVQIMKHVVRGRLYILPNTQVFESNNHWNGEYGDSLVTSVYRYWPCTVEWFLHRCELRVIKKGWKRRLLKGQCILHLKCHQGPLHKENFG